MERLRTQTGIVRQPEMNNSRKLLTPLKLEGKWDEEHLRAPYLGRYWAESYNPWLHLLQKSEGVESGAIVKAWLLWGQPKTPMRENVLASPFLAPLSLLVSPGPTKQGAIYKVSNIINFPVKTNQNRERQKMNLGAKRKMTNTASVRVFIFQQRFSICSIARSTV